MDQRFDHLVQLLETSPEEAEAALRTLLDEPNTAVRARSELRRIYRDRGDDTALAELFERDAAKAATPEAAALLYFELGESLHEMGQLSRAIAMWQRALRLDPAHRPSLRRKRETHLEAGRLEAARSVADREVELWPADADPTIFVELGQLALEHPFRYEFARSCADEALRLDPAAPGARGILDSLDSLADGWKEEARKLRSRAADERDRQVAARIYLKVAGLHAAFDQARDKEEKVAEALRRTFLLSPALPEALEFLERRHGASEDFEGLARTYESLLEMATENDPRVDILLRLANLYEIRFDDRARAIESLARASSLNPSRTDAVFPLVERLEDDGRHLEAAHHLERHLAVSQTAANQRATRLQLAELYQQIDRPDRARIHFEALSRLDPGNAKAEAFLAPIRTREEEARPFLDRLRANPADDDALEHVEELLADQALAPLAADVLERVYDKARDWPSLRHVIEIRIDASTDSVFRLKELRRLALLASRELRDPALAFSSLLRAFREAPGDALLRSELRVAAAQASLVPVLAETMEEVAGELAANGSLTQAMTVERELAELHEKKLSDPMAAASCWRRIRALDPRNVEALRALHRLDRELGIWEELRVVCLALSALVFDKAERQNLWREAADVALEEMADRELAIEPLEHLAEIDLDAADRLERILGGLERWEEQAKVLRRLLAARPETDGARRLALLLRDRLGDPAGALKVLEARLPGDEAAMEILADWASGIARGASEAAVLLDSSLAGLGRHEERLVLWEKRLDHSPADEKLLLHRKLLAITEKDLGRAESAFLLACRAFPLFPELGQELERLAGASDSWAELVGVYEDAAATGMFELRRKVAAIHEERLGDPAAAIDAWTAVVAREPDDLEALDHLARLLGQEGRHAEQLDALERRARAAREPSDERHGWMVVAGLATGMDPVRAAAAYRSALSVDPDHLPAVEGLASVLDGKKDRDELLAVLERLIASGAPGDREAWKSRQMQILEEAGSWEDLVGLLEERLGRGEDPETRCRLAGIRLEKQRDPEGALALYRENLTADPDHPGTLEALEAWATGTRVDRGEAARLLLSSWEAQDHHPGQVRMLEVLASLAEGREKASLLRTIATLHEGPLASAEMAFLTAGRALEADPDDPENLELACRTGAAADLEEELVGILGVVWESAGAGRLELSRTRARLLDRQGDPGAAARDWERVRSLAPDDREAMDRLLAAYEEGGDTTSQLEVLRTLLAREEDPLARRQHLLSMARIQEIGSRDSSAAIQTYRAILELVPEDEQALEALDRLCTEQGRWVELAEVLRTRAGLHRNGGKPDLWVELLLRLADLKEEKLLDREGAVESWGRILEERPEEPRARERLQLQLDENPGDFTVLSILEKALSITGDYPALAEILDARVSATVDPQVRKAVLIELAALRGEQLGRPDLAFLTYSRAFRDEPSEARLWEALFATARAADSLEEWLALWEDTFERGRCDRAAALHVAPLCERELGDGEAAIRWYERARSDDDLQVLAALERLYRQNGRWKELAGVLEALAEGEENPAEKINLLFRVGGLAEEKLDDPARAMEAWERILSLEPANLPALRALEPLYEKAGAFEKLKANLEAQRSLAEGRSWIRLTQRVAQVAADSLADEETAIAMLRELLDREPGNGAALQLLERLLETDGRAGERVELWRKRLENTREPREIVALHEKIGETLADQLGDLDGAVRSYEAILQSEPRHRLALEALAGLHQRRGDGDSLVATLRRLVPLQADARGVKATRLALAEALAETGREAEAIEDARRVLDLEPHDLAQLQRVEILLRELKAWEEVARTMDIQAALVEKDDPRLASDLWRGIASLWSEELGRSERAAPSLEKILAHHRDPDAFTTLCAIYRQSEDWRRYANLVEAFAAGAQGSERADLLRELAAVFEERLGQKELAFVRLGSAFELRPFDEELRADLWRLADEAGMHEELALIVESVADTEEPGPVALDLFLALGALHDQKLDDSDEAEAALRRALEIDPVEPRALDALASLFEKRGNGRSLALILERQLEATADLERKRLLLHRLASVSEKQLGDTVEAAAALERAFELDPTDEGTFEALAALYERSGRLLELTSLLARGRDLREEPEARRDLQLRLAQILEVGLEDDDGAAAALSLALEYDGACLEALDSLERIHGRHSRWAELLRVYDRKLELIEDPAERARLLVKAAGIWEENFQNAHHAIACLEGALSFEPNGISILRELGRLLRATGSFGRLVQILEHQETLVDGEEKVDLHIRLGDVLYRELGQIDGAEAAYRRALSLDPGARGALSALGRLYERSGNWPFALQMLTAEAELLGSGREAVELHHRIGSIHQEMLLDGASAEAAYGQALALDPSHLPTLRAMQLLKQSRGDRGGYLEALKAEAEHTRDPSGKTRLYHTIGSFLLESGGDEDDAVQAFEKARRHSPDDLEASRALADLYVARAAWAEAETVLDVVCEGLARGGAEAFPELSQRLYRLGVVAEKLGRESKALHSFARAWELDPTFLSAGEGLARLLVRSGDHGRALRTYQALLIHHRDRLSDPEVVEIHWIIGDLRNRLGEVEAALKSFANGLELDPWHTESHRSTIAVAEGAGRLDLALVHRNRLLEILEGDERFELLLDTASMAREKLGDPWQAIDCYTNARRIHPDDPAVLENLVELYRETRQPARAVELLERLLAHEEVRADGDRAIRFHLLLGEILGEEAARDPACLSSAVDHFNEVLDRDWRRTDAFASLEKLLASRGDWRGLESNYVRMLQRMPKEEGSRQARILLYRSLGDLYLNALGDSAAAADAFHAVTVLAPDDGQALVALARHRSTVQGQEAEAIDTWRQALPFADDLLEAGRQLEKLHVKKRDYDGAWVAASVVTDLLGKGGADEAGILEKLGRFARTSASGTLSDELFREGLCHEGVRGNVAMILGLVWTHAGSAFASGFEDVTIDGRSIRIDRRRQRIPLDEGLFFVHAYNLMASALACTPPELYKVPGVRGVHLVNTWPLAVVVGEEMFTDARNKKELYFAIASQLVYARSRLTMASMGEAALAPIFEAAVGLGDGRFRTGADPDAVAAARKRLEKALPKEVLPVLQKVAWGYARDRQREDLAAYLRSAALTSARAGMLLCADLAVARKGIAGEDTGEMARFGLSRAFLELRAALGLSVVVPG